MIKDNIGHSTVMAMTGHSNRRQGKRVRQIQVNSDKSFDAALQQQLRVLVEQLGIVTVDSGQEKIATVAQVAFNSCNDGSAIRIADFLGNDADGIGSLAAQAAGQEIRLVIQFSRCL